MAEQLTRSPVRADAQRNVESLRTAARAVFAESGVDAPAKQVADRAGVGVGTLYRHFPQRSDLIIAVLQQNFDECVATAAPLRAAHPAGVALAAWLQQFTRFVAAKHGLAEALHSGDPAYEGLPAYFLRQFEKVLDEVLLQPAIASGEVRSDVSAGDLLRAVSHLCLVMPGDSANYSQRMVAVLVDGLRLAV